MFTLILTLLNRDEDAPYYNPYEGLLEKGEHPNRPQSTTVHQGPLFCESAARQHYFLGFRV